MNQAVTQQPAPSRTAAEIRALLDAQGITFSHCIDAFGESRETNPYVLAAQHQHHDEGEIEIDDTAPLSEGDEGSWVMAWIWVSRNDAENYPERLQELLPAARSVRGLTGEQTAHLDWVEDLVTHLADDIARIIQQPIPADAAPTPIIWEDRQGHAWTFLPSVALATLASAANLAFAPHERVEAIELFCRTFGPQLDGLAGVASATQPA